MDHRYKRLFSYFVGFILFYAPVALFQRMLLFLLGQSEYATIHNLCFRIPIEHILSSKIFMMISNPTVIATILLIITAVLFGPIFCGKLCPAGAFPEYFSKLISPQWQINWGKYLPVAPLRYGFLLGFIMLPLVEVYLACSYCNYYVFDLLVNYWILGYPVALSSSLLLTFIIWFLIFGIFTRGGRGFCNFFCPVGAFQNFIYWVSCQLNFPRKLTVAKKKCIDCHKCSKRCPTTALTVGESGVEINIHHCILCMECVNNCTAGAISYGKVPRKGIDDNEK